MRTNGSAADVFKSKGSRAVSKSLTGDAYQCFCCGDVLKSKGSRAASTAETRPPNPPPHIHPQLRNVMKNALRKGKKKSQIGLRAYSLQQTYPDPTRNLSGFAF